jgi:hypothetical protein
MAIQIDEIEQKLQELREEYKTQITKRPIIVRRARALQIAKEIYEKRNKSL